MRIPVRPLAAAGGAVLLSSLVLAACGGGSTIVVDGQGAQVSINPSAGISVGSSDGSVVIGSNKLPDGWPADVGMPEGFTVAGSATTTSDGKPAYTASLSADGDQLAAVNSWLQGLEAKGYAKKASFGGTTTDGSMVALANAEYQVTSIATVSDGKTGLLLNVSAPTG